MKRPNVIAEVVEPGHCRYFQPGQRFTLGGFTPAGLCASAYTALCGDAQTMRCGGTLPWAREGKVLTRCPDPQGVLWQLRLERRPEAVDIEAIASTAPESDGQGRYHLQPCRGLRGSCPFALVTDPSLTRQVDLAVRASAWWARLEQHNGKSTAHHRRLRVALAACPNACTMPQIRDLGIIATVTPRAIRPRCNGCGGCERTCREEAILVQEGRAVLHADRCVGCGQCIERCPYSMIDPGPVRLRILVGGRMGRHPKWAQELAEVDVESVAKVVQAVLDTLAPAAAPAEQVADAVEKVTMERLRQEAFSAVGTDADAGSMPQAASCS